MTKKTFKFVTLALGAEGYNVTGDLYDANNNLVGFGFIRSSKLALLGTEYKKGLVIDVTLKEFTPATS